MIDREKIPMELPIGTLVQDLGCTLKKISMDDEWIDINSEQDCIVEDRKVWQFRDFGDITLLDGTIITRNERDEFYQSMLAPAGITYPNPNANYYHG